LRLISTDKENDFHRLKKECPQITTDYFLMKEIKKEIVHRLHRLFD